MNEYNPFDDSIINKKLNKTSEPTWISRNGVITFVGGTPRGLTYKETALLSFKYKALSVFCDCLRHAIALMRKIEKRCERKIYEGLMKEVYGND